MFTLDFFDEYWKYEFYFEYVESRPVNQSNWLIFEIKRIDKLFMPVLISNFPCV